MLVGSFSSSRGAPLPAAVWSISSQYSWCSNGYVGSGTRPGAQRSPGATSAGETSCSAGQSTVTPVSQSLPTAVAPAAWASSLSFAAGRVVTISGHCVRWQSGWPRVSAPRDCPGPISARAVSPPSSTWASAAPNSTVSHMCRAQ